MSMACSIPCINLRTSSSSPNSSSSSSCSPSSSSSSCSSAYSPSIRHSFRFASVQPYAVTIRCSQADGPLRRPVVPPLREPSAPTPIKPAPTPPASPSPPAKVAPISSEEKDVITLEFQRLKAKELQDYFKQKKLEEANQGPFFGFIGKNEIANGRWAMFGFAVGMLTEYSTGSSFVDQVKILLSNFGNSGFGLMMNEALARRLALNTSIIGCNYIHFLYAAFECFLPYHLLKSPHRHPNLSSLYSMDCNNTYSFSFLMVFALGCIV